MTAPASERPVWSPSGVVALTTDFGTGDVYVGQLKAVLLARAPGLAIVDLTHGVPPQDVLVGAFLLARSRAYFAPGTVHVVVVDPGVGSARRILVAWDAGQVFLAPDNGLLPAALGADAEFRELDTRRFALPDASRTFHGRDVFAPAAAALARGLAPWDAGRALATGPVPGVLPRARPLAPGRVEAHVLFADRYGNLVLDADPADLAGDLRAWRAEVRGRSLEFRATYSGAGSGEALALVDSFGAIELAVRDGNAAASLGLTRGDTVLLRRGVE
jgi:hypothetical protein